MAPWDAAGGGGGMLGGVARGCVFTSAGESGIAVAFSFLSAVGATGGGGREKETESRLVRPRGRGVGTAQAHLVSGRGLEQLEPGRGTLCPQPALEKP